MNYKAKQGHYAGMGRGQKINEWHEVASKDGSRFITPAQMWRPAVRRVMAELRGLGAGCPLVRRRMKALRKAKRRGRNCQIAKCGGSGGW